MCYRRCPDFNYAKKHSIYNDNYWSISVILGDDYWLISVILGGVAGLSMGDLVTGGGEAEKDVSLNFTELEKMEIVEMRNTPQVSAHRLHQ